MDIPTISRIKELRDEIRKARKPIRHHDYDGQTFGPESEYSAKGLLAGLDALIIDISSLVKAPARFVKLSNHAERNQLVSLLTNIRNATVNKDLSGLASHVDSLKPHIAKYGIRHSDDRLSEFDAHIDALQRKASELSTQIQELEETKTRALSLQEDIDTAYEKLTEKLEELSESEEKLTALIDNTEAQRQQVETLLSVDQERSENIKELLADAKSHREVIESFSKRISQRESQLEDQGTATNTYNQTLVTFKNEREVLLSEARALIESAKSALEFKTAEGLSASFSAKYKESKQDPTTRGWIFGAAAFIGTAIGIGLWVFFEKDVQIEAVLGRISMIPILVASAWFCAGQYVKQRNITEDYAYKSVLAKSLIGFAEQLSDDANKGNDHSYFVKSILAEIHNDPLRPRPQRRVDNKALQESVRKMIEESELFKRISEKLSG